MCAIFELPVASAIPRWRYLSQETKIMHRSKYPLLHLRDLLHLVNKGMLDYVRDKTHQPQAQDFEMLKEIFAMGEQIKGLA